jgi:enoyl-CoA hydratase/carnithine racemase
VSDDPILVERRGAGETHVINYAPPQRMSIGYIDALEIEIKRIANDPGVRVFVLRGAGTENFSVGMNLKQLPAGIKAKGSPDAVFDQRLRVIAAIENMDKPSIAVLNGYCLGGGLELPLGCHFRLAAEEGAQIGLPEMDLGSVPAWGGSARLTRCVGRDHALDMILRGKKISGPEALRIGLVHEVWPLAELFDRAQALADELAAQPRLAVAAMLRCIVGAETKSLEESLADERAAVLGTFGTADQREGMQAFLEKREPVFNQDVNEDTNEDTES